MNTSSEPIVYSIEEPPCSSGHDDLQRLFHRQEFEQVLNNIEGIAERSRKAPQTGSINPNYAHQAILVSGNPGSGKSTFLLTLCRFFNNAQSSSDDPMRKKFKDLHVRALSKTIDPCIWSMESSAIKPIDFLIECVSSLSADWYESSQSIKDDQLRVSYENAYEDFTVAAEAHLLMIGSDRKNHESGAGQLWIYQKNQELKKCFEDLVIAYARGRSLNALVLPIDDADLRPESIKPLCEFLRVYITNPLLVPVVCADFHLLEKVLIKKFSELSLDLKKEDVKRYYTQQIDKLFIRGNRVNLRGIDEIIVDTPVHLTVKELSTEGKPKYISFFDFYQKTENLALGATEETKWSLQTYGSLHFGHLRVWSQIMYQLRRTVCKAIADSDKGKPLEWMGSDVDLCEESVAPLWRYIGLMSGEKGLWRQAIKLIMTGQPSFDYSVRVAELRKGSKVANKTVSVVEGISIGCDQRGLFERPLIFISFLISSLCRDWEEGLFYELLQDSPSWLGRAFYAPSLGVDAKQFEKLDADLKRWRDKNKNALLDKHMFYLVYNQLIEKPREGANVRQAIDDLNVKLLGLRASISVSDKRLGIESLESHPMVAAYATLGVVFQHDLSSSVDEIAQALGHLKHPDAAKYIIRLNNYYQFLNDNSQLDTVNRNVLIGFLLKKEITNYIQALGSVREGGNVFKALEALGILAGLKVTGSGVGPLE